MQDKILVLGGTGTVGSEVARLLKEKGYNYVVGLRNADKSEAPSVTLDYFKEETFAPALEGVTGVFMITPGFMNGIEGQFKKFIQAAEEAGTQHLVYSSVIGADGNPEGTHRQIELALEASSVDHTVLRPNFYMQNFITYEGENTKQGQIFLPTDEGKTSYIDVRDIARVAEAVLLNPDHTGKTYTLTGQDSLDNNEIAGIFSDVTGKPFNNINPSESEYEQTLQSYGVPESVIAASKDLYSYIRSGYMGGVTPDYQAITGQQPTPFKTFATDFVR